MIKDIESAMYKNHDTTLLIFFFVPRLFEEKWRDTVFGFPWGVVRGAWCVVRGSEFLVGTLSP